jgi:hypothetical protein
MLALYKSAYHNVHMASWRALGELFSTHLTFCPTMTLAHSHLHADSCSPLAGR